MTIEQSKGKARPTLPRLSDAPKAPARERSANHDALGRFTTANTGGADKGVKQDVTSMLGTSRRARRLYRRILRDLPSDGVLVRLQVVAMVRAQLAAAEVWDAAIAAGLGTPEGAELEARAVRLSERAERLSITAWDFATKRTGIPSAEPPSGLAPFAVPRGGR